MNRHAYTEPMVYCARCAEYKYFSEVQVVNFRKSANKKEEVVQFVCPDCGTQTESKAIR